MSIFTKAARAIITPIAKPIIIKEVGKRMDKFEGIINLVAGLVDKYGTKFLVALGSCYGLYSLADKGKIEGIYAGLGIVIIAGLYFVVRRNQEKEQLVELEECNPPEVEVKP